MDHLVPVIGLVELDWSLLRRWLVFIPVALLVLVAIRKFGVEEGEQHKEGTSLPGSRLTRAARAYALKPWLVKVIVLSPIAIMLVYGCLFLFFSQSTVYSMVRNYLVVGEKNVAEMLTFAFQLLAGILGLALAWQLRKRGEAFLVIGFYALFAVALLWTAGEEVAWGQKIVGKEAIPTPSWLENKNQQSEFTLHNVGELHEYGSGLFTVGFGLAGLVGIWVSSWSRFRKVGAPLILLPWFLIIFLISVCVEIGGKDSYTFYRQLDPLPKLPWEFEELTELLIGVSAFLFVWLNARMLSSIQEASPTLGLHVSNTSP